MIGRLRKWLRQRRATKLVRRMRLWARFDGGDDRTALSYMLRGVHDVQSGEVYDYTRTEIQPGD